MDYYNFSFDFYFVLKIMNVRALECYELSNICLYEKYELFS